MANTNLPVETYPLPQDSYVAFDAISLRNLIISRLNEQNIFTDQNYLGSNLASIIDIVSYAFNTLIFYLNRTSSESMFSEAQLYENVNRIVKLLDYKPIGYQTSTLSFQCSSVNLPAQSYTIPRYSYISIGNISFSFNEDVRFSTTSANLQFLDFSNKKLLHQGIYRELPTQTATGDTNETVIIDSTNALIDHFNIDVYVFEQDLQRWIQYQNIPNFYGELATARVFEKRLNGDLSYQITFGNGVNGRRLSSGDLIAIYYLQSSGNVGVVGPNTLSGSIKTLFTTNKFKTILSDINTLNDSYMTNSEFARLQFDNIVGSSLPSEIENSDSIRQNAPSNFKSQYRLVTKTDYETYVKTFFSNIIGDVKIFTNWEYSSKYLKYFNDINVSPTAFKQILLNQVLYADSCNFNNIYVCALPKSSVGTGFKYLAPTQKELIRNSMESLKTLTSEITFVDPIYKYIDFGIPDENEEVQIEDSILCNLEVVKSSVNRRSSDAIQKEVKEVFQTFFSSKNLMLGQMLSFIDLTKALLEIDGVQRIRTKRTDTGKTIENLSLFMWNPVYPTLDKVHVTTSVEIREFEAIIFQNIENIFPRILVVENI